MVFHYTNYVVETNVWWLRRLRPQILGAVGIWAGWVFYRYFFFGKTAAKSNRKMTQEEREFAGQKNKRSWGYNQRYKPTLERSMKNVLYNDPNYQFPIGPAERWMSEDRTVEQILEDENENWTYYK